MQLATLVDSILDSAKSSMKLLETGVHESNVDMLALDRMYTLACKYQDAKRRNTLFTFVDVIDVYMNPFPREKYDFMSLEQAYFQSTLASHHLNKQVDMMIN